MYAVLPTHTTEAGITLAVVGILLGVNRAVRLAFNGIAGWLYDRFSQRRLFLIGLSIGAFSTACYAIAREFWLLFSGRVFWGMAWSLIWIGGGTIILNLTEESERGRWTGFYQTWFFLGAGVGAFIGGLLTDFVGYTSTMWILAGIQACSMVLVMTLLPNIPKSSVRSDAEQGWPFLSRMLVQPELLVTIVLQGMNRFCFAGVLMATLGLLVEERLVSPNIRIGAATITGGLIVGRTVVSMFAAPVAGHLSDRIGSRWTVLVQVFFGGIFAFILLAFHSPLLLIIGFLVSAVIMSAVQSLTITLTGDLVEEAHRGKAISLLHTVGDLGSALGPPCAYALLFSLGLTGIYLLCAGLLMAGLGLILSSISDNV
jgi:MFS family permease